MKKREWFLRKYLHLNVNNEINELQIYFCPQRLTLTIMGEVFKAFTNSNGIGLSMES